MKKINLITRNHHNLNYISDQIYFLKTYFKKINISKKYKKNYVNFIIEGTSCTKNLITSDFSIILTEHLDYDPNTQNFKFHNKKINEIDDYISVENKIKRLKNLFKLLPLAKNVYTLSDLPINKNLNHVFPSLKIERLNFPKIKALKNIKKKKYDFCFFGTRTEYRIKILNEIKKKFKVFIVLNGRITFKKKAKISQESIFQLNIPQNPFWEWPSNLRIFSSLSVGGNILNIDNGYLIKGTLKNFNKFTLSELLNNFKKIKKKCTYYKSVKNFNKLNGYK